jgi:hypothetical protein
MLNKDKLKLNKTKSQPQGQYWSYLSGTHIRPCRTKIESAGLCHMNALDNLKERKKDKIISSILAIG